MNVDRQYVRGASRAAIAGRRVAVLMAVRNGEKYLDLQIASIARQRVGRIDLWISDDGSQDGTREVAERMMREWTFGDVRLLEGPQKGFAENFRALMTRPDIEADYFAFCDQDDLWEEDKLSFAIAWLEAQPAGQPALFCSRTRIITADGQPAGDSPLFEREPSFRNALVQSIAGGNTMVMNRAARQCVLEASRRTSFISHDWWCYQIVSGVGGTVHYSPESKIGYRQHGDNLVGENNSWRARMFRLHFLAKGRFQRWNDTNLAALGACEDMLTPEARRVMNDFRQARSGNVFSRLAALRRSGVYRQTFLGHIGLFAACVLGKL